MLTLKRILEYPPETLSLGTSWYLSDLGEAKGRQGLHARQLPQRLKALRESSIIESAVSSNRIEGVEVDKKRIGTVVFGKSHLRDRNEEEVRGYRLALNLIHTKAASLPVSEKTILEFHRLIRGEIWDAGKYKDKDSDIIERYPDGKSRIRFKTVPAAKTPAKMKELVECWNEAVKQVPVHPLILLAAFNLDFLCIHPFRDGNGRVSRLLLLLQCYHLDFQVGRFISIERLIEQNKARYYETLERSSQGWHEGKNDFFLYTNYLLFVLKSAYQEFENRLGRLKTQRGEKTERILNAIREVTSPFRISDIAGNCPGISIDMIRRVMKQLAKEGKIMCMGRGPNARWERKRNPVG
jgi:Fic family protein